jgi:hypothetical protein
MSTQPMSLLAQLRNHKPNKIDPNLQRDLKHGWMLPYLLGMDERADGRWDYWCRTLQAGQLLDDPIPQIDWCDGLRDASPWRKHCEECLDLVAHSGHAGWMGWSSWDNFDYFLSWLLFGFGCAHQRELPREPTKGASMRLYQHFNLGWPLAYPYDVFGDLMAECRMGQSSGFYPTPMSLCVLMMRMTLEGGDARQTVDHRAQSVHEPCVGTGRMLLAASNFSMVLSGQDISAICVKATLCNGYLYAPWLVKPLSFLRESSFDGEPVDQGNAMTSPPATLMLSAPIPMLTTPMLTAPMLIAPMLTAPMLIAPTFTAQDTATPEVNDEPQADSASSHEAGLTPVPSAPCKPVRTSQRASIKNPAQQVLFVMNADDDAAITLTLSEVRDE